MSDFPDMTAHSALSLLPSTQSYFLLLRNPLYAKEDFFSVLALLARFLYWIIGKSRSGIARLFHFSEAFAKGFPDEIAPKLRTLQCQ